MVHLKTVADFSVHAAILMPHFESFLTYFTIALFTNDGSERGGWSSTDHSSTMTSGLA